MASDQDLVSPPTRVVRQSAEEARRQVCSRRAVLALNRSATRRRVLRSWTLLRRPVPCPNVQCGRMAAIRCELVVAPRGRWQARIPPVARLGDHMSDTPRDSAEEQFAALFADNYGEVVRYVERRLADSEVARELANECFLIAWRQFDPNAPFARTWLYTTARNLLANEYRRRRREFDARVWLVGPQTTDVPRDDRVDLISALRRMPEDQREVLALSYWEGLSAEEISKVLGISNGNARVRLSRARAQLRVLLESTEAVSSEDAGVAK